MATIEERALATIPESCNMREYYGTEVRKGLIQFAIDQRSIDIDKATEWMCNHGLLTQDEFSEFCEYMQDLN